MNIKDFKTPDKHPYQMLEHLKLEHTYEIESFLVWMLSESIKKNGFIALACKLNHDHLIDMDLLDKTADCTYKLTKRAQKLLFIHYGKE